MVRLGQRFRASSRNRVEQINTIRWVIDMNYETKMMFEIFSMFEVELLELDKDEYLDVDDVMRIMKDCIYRGLQADLFGPRDCADKKGLAKGAAGETIINVSLPEWELIETVIEASFDRISRIRQGSRGSDLILVVERQVKAVEALAKYRKIDL